MGSLERTISQQSKELQNAWLDALRPPEILTCSEFAEQHIILTDSAIPGRFDCENAPYQKEILDAFSDPNIERIVIVASAQVGKTQSIIAMLGYAISQDPNNCMMVTPTLELGEAIMLEKIEPVIENSPRLKKLIFERRQKGGHRSKRKLQFEGGTFSLAGTRNGRDLRTRSTKYLFCDEVDEFEFEVKGQGDPLSLALARQTTFSTFKTVLASTPTLKGQSRIMDEFEKTDQRAWLAKCQHCGEHVEIVQDDIDFKAREWLAPCCGCAHSEGQRMLATKAGMWEPMAVAAYPRSVGFRLNELSSTFSSLEKIAAKWTIAQESELKKQAYINTTLGQPYNPEIELDVTAEILAERAIEIDKNTLPDEAGLVTASVDLQKDWAEIQFAAWGVTDCWILDQVKLTGDPTGTALWGAIEETLQRNFMAGASAYRPEVVCIDAGNWTNSVYDFVERAWHHDRLWLAIKGRADADALIERSASKPKQNVKLHIVGTNRAKNIVFRRLANEDEKNPRIHLPAHLKGTDFFEQLCAERAVTKANDYGHERIVYEKIGKRRNEALDLLVYNLAARDVRDFDIEWRLNQKTQIETSGQTPSTPAISAAQLALEGWQSANA